MVKRCAMLVTIVSLLISCGPSGISESISAAQDLAATAQAVATTVDVAMQETAPAESASGSDDKPSGSAKQTDAIRDVSEYVDPEVFEAMLADFSSYTFSLETKMTTSKGNGLHTHLLESHSDDPEALQLISTTYNDDGSETQVTNTYSDQWYTASADGCNVQPLDLQALEMAMSMNRTMGMMLLIMPIQTDIEELDGTEYNGIPAKHYRKVGGVDSAVYKTEESAEWWVSDDGVLLWAHRISRTIAEDVDMTNELIYNLEQTDQQLNITKPDGC